MESLLLKLAVTGAASLPDIQPPPLELWTPAQLLGTGGAGLRGWWDTDALGLTVGDAIPSIVSGAGLSNPLSQETAGWRPTYQLLSGHGAMRTDGTDDSMGMADLSISSGAPAITFFMAYKLESVPSDNLYKHFAGVSIPGALNRRFSLSLNNNPSKALGIS